MKQAIAELLAPLLGALRGYSMLDEVKPATFHLRGRDFIHFHETPDGVVADVLLARGRVHMSVCTSSEQAELLERIENRLASLEEHGQQKRQRLERRRRG